MARALIAGFVAALWLAGPSVAAAAPPAQIKIHVIEASKKTKTFDKRLGDLKKGIVGFTGATLLDEITTTVQPGSAVSLEFVAGPQKKKETLRVKLLDAKPNAPITLEVTIKAFDFKAKTKHKKSGATVFVAHATGKDTALFLAGTPTR